MLHFTERLDPHENAGSAKTLVLNHEQRRRSRQRVRLTDGSEAGILLPRGTLLEHGDLLRSEEGVLARVSAAPEHVSVAQTSDALLLTRAAYHLGNRHVALRVEPGRLIYPRDSVLDGMCRELGLSVTEELLPFEPERGGYAGAHQHG